MLGLNTDRDAKDAQFVIDAMKLNYTTLRLDPQSVSNLNVRAFPSLVIVDRDGVVRFFDEGYSSNLREDLTKKIRLVLRQH